MDQTAFSFPNALTGGAAVCSAVLLSWKDTRALVSGLVRTGGGLKTAVFAQVVRARTRADKLITIPDAARFGPSRGSA